MDTAGGRAGGVVTRQRAQDLREKLLATGADRALFVIVVVESGSISADQMIALMADYASQADDTFAHVRMVIIKQATTITTELTLNRECPTGGQPGGLVHAAVLSKMEIVATPMPMEEHVINRVGDASTLSAAAARGVLLYVTQQVSAKTAVTTIGFPDDTEAPCVRVVHSDEEMERYDMGNLLLASYFSHAGRTILDRLCATGSGQAQAFYCEDRKQMGP